MKKELRLLVGIIMHPVRVIIAREAKKRISDKLLGDARARQWHKNHERMHEMSSITNTAYTESPLYNNLFAGAPEWRD